MVLKAARRVRRRVRWVDTRTRVGLEVYRSGTKWIEVEVGTEVFRSGTDWEHF